ncbi:hypothetical protein PHYSODRAFT_316562 [Phytophthora sojae]|uniref:Uncharacterized protein n=1 Tax=Phytophthora sojae (strain P6497) TaxID=1094619 RepID=G4ZTS9_PHYSP|nr:hypothetical protein PHYSODRAFT_316562 [Phytophthora sojae]EGZ13203.1 hypothetical protein PHYSODRAFT_316562 [Phytophthora sojae]|eukprot:XP_009530632.1 hypothetical protein PHYSODRAFT_316562 [Phytophthora sojae]
MAASSQGDDDDDERRALERELAEELASLSAQDVGFDECDSGGDDEGDENAGWMTRGGEIAMEYVRLDLDKVLQQVTEASADELHAHSCQPILPSAWELLLQGVERVDREFFQPIHENLDDIRTTILDAKSPQQATPEENTHHSQISDEEADYTSRDIEGSLLEQTIPPVPDDSNQESSKLSTDVGEIQDRPTVQEKKEPIASKPVTDSTVEQITDSVEATPTDSEPVSVDHPSNSSNKQRPVDDSARQNELDAIAKQHAARESRRLKIQARQQKERDEAASFLRQLQEEFEAQEKGAEAARKESLERSLMTNEELRSRLYASAMREFHETALMVLADEESRTFTMELARVQQSICREVAMMTIEDQAERQRMQLERQLQQQKQDTLARCQFGAVLSELVKYHQVQSQLRDQHSKRERRECVQMRAEEAFTRRIIAETLAQRELQVREQNRALMLLEDELARALEDIERARELQVQERLREQEYRSCMEKEERRCRSAWTFIEALERERRQNEERCRISMRQEEERSRSAWAYLVKLEEAAAMERESQRELQRLHVLANTSAGIQGIDRVFQQHKLVSGLEKWKQWHAQCVEEDRVRSMAVENAATVIQLWHRSCRRRREELDHVEIPLVLEDFSDDDEQPQVEDAEDDNEGLEPGEYTNSAESQEAALRLQSTFRGFHVRRKFANAIALAQVVAGPEEGDTFDAVNLDDLIQLPPELVDGWEDPVLPPALALEQRQYIPPPCAGDEEDQRPEHADNNEADDKAATRLESSTLWNKMKRAKQRQQHAQQERKRQQDPSYRVQKLLNRKPTASNQNGHASNSNQSSHTQKVATNTVSWSSTSSQKKKPKVKLPSLVERLRRQTMAER